MGLTTVSTYAVWLVTFLTAAAVTTPALRNGGERVEDGLEWRQAHEREKMDTDLQFESKSYSKGGGGTVTITIRNNGTTVLDPRYVSFTLDGTAAFAASWSVSGVASARAWVPREAAVFTFNPMGSDVSKVTMTTESGRVEYW